MSALRFLARRRSSLVGCLEERRRALAGTARRTRDAIERRFIVALFRIRFLRSSDCKEWVPYSTRVEIRCDGFCWLMKTQLYSCANKKKKTVSKRCQRNKIPMPTDNKKRPQSKYELSCDYFPSSGSESRPFTGMGVLSASRPFTGKDHGRFVRQAEPAPAAWANNNCYY